MELRGLIHWIAKAWLARFLDPLSTRPGPAKTPPPRCSRRLPEAPHRLSLLSPWFVSLHFTPAFLRPPNADLPSRVALAVGFVQTSGLKSEARRKARWAAMWPPGQHVGLNRLAESRLMGSDSLRASMDVPLSPFSNANSVPRDPTCVCPPFDPTPARYGCHGV